MKELSLNILDITENSLKAGSRLTEILISETGSRLEIKIIDNGKGMKAEVVAAVTNPFYTTRTTRSVGLGIPLLKLQAEQAGGSLEIKSRHIEEFPDSHGTVVTAVFDKSNIDCTPLGNIVETMLTLIQGHPESDFLFNHKIEEKEVLLDTRQLREVLGDVPLNNYEVIKWIEEYLSEQYSEIYNK